MGRQKSGISMLSLQRMLEIKTYKTVWTMGHKIRQAMAARDANYKLAGLIEMDDTYFGVPTPGKRGRGAAGKAKVVLAVETPADKPRFAAMRLVPRVCRQVATWRLFSPKVCSAIFSDRWKRGSASGYLP